jgi:hypothetical protein
MRDLGRYEGAVGGHAPGKACGVGVVHDFKEIPVKKRLSAGDAESGVFGAEIPFDFIYDTLPLIGCQWRFFGYVSAHGTAMKTMLVTFNSELEKKRMQSGMRP